MQTTKKNYFKFISALTLCLLVRFIPFRAPNIEPILSVTMPFGKRFGALTAFSFAFLSIFLYDVFTGTLGMQTFFTVTAYSVLGLWSAYYFKTRVSNRSNYVRFAVMGTLFFDAATGLTVGPLFFNQTFISALMGQIPFTAFHLLGNIAFAMILSPAIYKFLIKKKTEQKIILTTNFNPKTI